MACDSLLWASASLLPHPNLLTHSAPRPHVRDKARSSGIEPIKPGSPPRRNVFPSSPARNFLGTRSAPPEIVQRAANAMAALHIGFAQQCPSTRLARSLRGMPNCWHPWRGSQSQTRLPHNASSTAHQLNGSPLLDARFPMDPAITAMPPLAPVDVISSGTRAAPSSTMVAPTIARRVSACLGVSVDIMRAFI